MALLATPAMPAAASISIYDQLLSTPPKKVAMPLEAGARSRSTSAGSSPVQRTSSLSDDGTPGSLTVAVGSGSRSHSPVRVKLDFGDCTDPTPAHEPAVVCSSLGVDTSLPPPPPPGLEFLAEEDGGLALAAGHGAFATLSVPPPPQDAPVRVGTSVTYQAAGVMPPPPPFAPTLCTNAAPAPALGSEAMPTVGSAGHHWGACRPCAFMHTKGCANGIGCQFCHLCPPGEKKRRKKAGAAVAAATSMAAAFAVQAATEAVYAAAMPVMPR